MIIPDPRALPGDTVTIANPHSRDGALKEGVCMSATYWAGSGTRPGQWSYGVRHLAKNGKWMAARILSDNGIRRGPMTEAERTARASRGAGK